VVYGRPAPVALELAARGEIVLGGCIVGRDSPRWQCSICRHRWGDAAPATRSQAVPTDPVRKDAEGEPT